MGKLNTMIALLVVLAFVLWYKTSDKEADVQVYASYVDRQKQHILSETAYLPDERYSFAVCRSRDGGLPCEVVYGLKHGMQKWYKNDALEYEDTYNKGEITNTKAYYENGFIKQELSYKNGAVVEVKSYSAAVANELTKSVYYSPSGVTKRYYIGGRIAKEEKYRNDRLVSRKIFDRDGLLIRLEEYGGSSDLEELFGPLLPQDDGIYEEPKRTPSKKPSTSEILDGIWV